MRIKEKKQNTAVSLVVFLLAVFAGTWLLTKMTPLVGDDFNYAFSWADDTRVDNFTLVVKSMISHRLWTHGRVFAQGWVTLFMMWPRWVFPLANAAVVTAFFAALYHFFKRLGTPSPLRACMAAAALYWVCMPVFGQVFLWLDGACNYFWGAAFAWILLELMWSAKDSRFIALWTFLLMPLAFAVGAWSEHISFAVIVIQFLVLVLNWVQRKRLPVMEGVILLVSCAGYLFLMFAPSMLPSILKARATAAAEEHLSAVSGFIAEKWWLIAAALVVMVLLIFWLKGKPTWQSRCVALSAAASGVCLLAGLYFACSALWTGGIWTLVSSTQAGFLMLLGFFFLCLMNAVRHNGKTEQVVLGSVLALGGICALVPFSVAMYVPARGFCAPVVFIGISTVLLWNSVERQSQRSRRIVTALLGGVFLLHFIPGMMDLVHVEKAAEARNRAIQEALDSDGVLYAVPYPVKTKYSAQYGIQDLAEGEYWPNEFVVKYYGLKDVVVRSAESE
ncbi:MAG TPA: hypothetical protein DCZ61_03850 [Lachnospiraceae bacterium]|nr:hypothetical protein [Lachnospiraceae bacterium]